MATKQRPRRKKSDHEPAFDLVGARVVAERERLGLTQAEFSVKHKIGGKTLSEVENEGRGVQFWVARRLADAFGCSIDYLAGRTKVRDVNQ